jgi:hypothetical protein
VDIGTVFSSTKIEAGPFIIRDYAQAVEGLGYSHLAVYEHVLGADLTNCPGCQGYTHRCMFREPFVLFGYLASLIHLELLAEVIILSQRQTVLVAKHATDGSMASAGDNTHLVNTPSAEFKSPNEQIDIIRRYKEAIPEHTSTWSALDFPLFDLS